MCNLSSSSCVCVPYVSTSVLPPLHSNPPTLPLSLSTISHPTLLQGWARCEVLIVDDRLARVYARSARVKKELPDYHEHLRTAVGVARCMQVRACVWA